MERILMLIATVIMIFGCSGKLYTVVNPNLNKQGEEEQKIQGVIAYHSIYVIELYELKTLVDKESGNIIGRAPNKCIPQQKLIFSVKADYSSPYIIVYEPGIFESNKFGVSLKDGILTNVNTESDTTKGVSALAELLPFVTAPKTAEFIPEDKPLPLCNAELKFKGLYRAPAIKSFEEIPK